MSGFDSDSEMMRENQRKDRDNDASDVHKLKRPDKADERLRESRERDGLPRQPQQGDHSDSLAEYAERDPRRNA